MQAFLYSLWNLITFRRLCPYCDGKGKVGVGYKNSEYIRCAVCAGKGLL